jgi:hypothetical protein
VNGTPFVERYFEIIVGDYEAKLWTCSQIGGGVEVKGVPESDLNEVRVLVRRLLPSPEDNIETCAIILHEKGY